MEEANLGWNGSRKIVVAQDPAQEDIEEGSKK
jgi:hypothetical protein